MIPSAVLEQALLFGIAPLWILAGTADFGCHRVMRIEQSTGARESLLHLLMIFELAVAALCPLIFQPNALLFTLMLSACIAHELTVWADLSYAESRRRVPWFEQWVHALQQSLPWAWLGGWMLVNTPQALALFGAGEAAVSWNFESRQTPLPAGYLPAFLLASGLLVAGPFLYEFWRCARRSRAIGNDRPPEAMPAVSTAKR
jgi:hypothetical protein